MKNKAKISKVDETLGKNSDSYNQFQFLHASYLS